MKFNRIFALSLAAALVLTLASCGTVSYTHLRAHETSV